MKKLISITLVFAVLLLIIPFVGTVLSGESFKSDTSKTSDGDVNTFKVLDVNSGEVQTVAYRDYVIGAVLAEMPSGYHIEALKAQAVAAFTYALRQQANEDISPTAELCGADFSNDSTHYQAYFSESEAKEKFGASYDDAYSKISEAVDSVYGQYLEFEGEPIAAAYHSISSGVTESALTVWGEDISYLVPEASEYDTSSPDYEHTEVFSADDLKAKISQYDSTIVFGEDKSGWISILETSDSGTVTSVKVGNATLSGTQLRAALSLRSACFTVSFADDSFTIVTKGYGHGVGLSQYGANGMAFSGYTYDQILTHYYNGAEIKNISLG